ncbi:MAG TPA: sigma-54 dependent transcriptional regulator [Rhodanobacteraceae bacterium]
MPADRFIAQSRLMRALVEQVRRFAAAESNVFIAGETGTGKNAVARELHVRGPRAKRPFVTIDCASLSASLIDSELFGHERGAFTDAVASRPGRFELAGNGTVYLDGVAELPVEAQGKLLRIVEEKRVERLGGHTSVAVGARIVASAGADIEDAVRSGRFRHDLYHRLRVLPLLVPPLREHPEDVLPLARYFLKKAAVAAHIPVPPLTRDAAAALRDYAWPGNVRELRHAIDRAFDAARGGAITLSALPTEILDAPAIGGDDALANRPTLDEVERRYIAATLRHARGNQTDAARALGISRKALWEKRKRYGLE